MRRPILIGVLLFGVVAGYGSAIGRAVSYSRGEGGGCGRWGKRQNAVTLSQIARNEAKVAQTDAAKANATADKALGEARAALDAAQKALAEAAAAKEQLARLQAAPVAPAPAADVGAVAKAQLDAQLQAQSLAMAQAQVQALTQALAQEQVNKLTAAPKN